VLDLACGVGRHSVVFSARGFNVTGLDYSKTFLREARKNARAARRKIRFVQGDMRDLEAAFAPGTFGLVVSLYNSFGYFGSRRDDLKMLKSAHRVLGTGGKFVINTLNGAGVARRLSAPVSAGREPLPNLFVIDSARLDSRNRQTVCTWTIIDARRPRARVLRKSFRQNIYSHHELILLLRAAGFRIESRLGMLQGDPFDPGKSWHQTIVARKP
jgi:SAM-dependent methyltransferase